ncbi:MAG: cation-translocating P-type ATPase C-terminal domain-containing protein [Cyanobacteria bacterium J06631_6]
MFFTLLVYGYGIANYGVGAHASAITFMSLATAQLLHAPSCRTDQPLWQGMLQPNNYLTIALVISLSLPFISLVLPSLGSLLRIKMISCMDLIIITVSALLPLIINEITKEVNS